MNRELSRILDDQAGVVTRSQIHSCGVSKPALDRMLRRRDLVRVLPGVFVNHTGDLTWLQRAWAGTLYYSPAALGKESALRLPNGPGWRGHDEQAPITITVDHGRRVSPHPGYVLERQRGFDDLVHWNSRPPRVRIEEAVLDVAAEQQSDLDSLEVLADACRSRRTTAVRLRQALVRAHGLPRSKRQVAMNASTGKIYRDVEYEEFDLIVELDGRLFHDNPRQRNRDLDRDLDAAVSGRSSIRLGWGQVYGTTCHTTSRVASLLATRGWAGTPFACSPVCGVRLDLVG